MTTVKQIERDWKARQYERLFQRLAERRSEAMVVPGPETVSVCAAAMAVVRLDELGQSHVPFCTALIRAILAAQQADGGWGEISLTALCLRALLCGCGNGLAVERGLGFVGSMQKPEGIWPAEPIRRMPEDAAASAFVIYQLGDQPAFHTSVKVNDAVAWFERNEQSLSAETFALWRQAELRCHMHDVMAHRASWIAA